MDLAKNIKQFREIADLSQKELSEKLGIKQPNISDWEKGKSRPEYENLIKLADIFDVSVDELLGRKYP